MSMTRAEVDALPKIELSKSAYAQTKKMECPKCGGRLSPENVTYFSTDGIELPGVLRTKVIRAGGCAPCKTIYRFEDNPIVREDIW